MRVDGVSRLIEHRARTLIAVLVPIAFHGACRESVIKVIGNDLPRRQIKLDLCAVFSGEVGQSPIEQGLGGRNELDDHAVVGCERILDRGEQRGQFHRQEKLTEEALLRAFEA